MGVKPSAAVNAAATEFASSGSETTHPTNGRFGMPHAFVITMCIATAGVLTQRGMAVSDALFLLAGASSIGGAVVLLVATGGRRAGRVNRLVRAYFTSGN
ncbi:hypothetical protein [Streptomyces sp. BE133]|uniref:hypothetical protein n=1 Tax=Streptomyces sp. BE133 TaxID=3002523 RepID=UPI002E76A2D9|nr:hypothetical protein [Streptomyces sp. BE133]MEE1808237.1 hypothetical protein [Streptomyces sp. BE133]